MIEHLLSCLAAHCLEYTGLVGKAEEKWQTMIYNLFAAHGVVRKIKNNNC